MSSRKKQQSKPVNKILPLQVEQNLDNNMVSGTASQWEIDRYFKTIVPFIEADIEMLRSLLPSDEMSCSEYIEFFNDIYPSVVELVRDGLYGEKYQFWMKWWDKLPQSSYYAKYQDLLKEIKTLHNDLILQGSTKFEYEIAKGLGTFEEAQAYYWISRLYGNSGG